ncbi:MAG: FHA domain-containing protein [Gammaproteobacteria bacterium]|nr:MAG: FHA domain-containing protein [Gammaproteobacteria bacterium]
MSFFYFVEILNAHGDVQARHKFTQLPVRLGRSYNNDIILDDHHTAAEHAVIELNESNDIIIRDLGSQNAIKVKGKVQPIVVMNGDTSVQLGHTHVRVRDSNYVVSDEVNDSVHSRWQGWPMFFSAVLMICILSLTTSWLSDIANNKSSDYIIGVAQWLLVAAVWSGIWALANRAFGGAANFTRHLFTFSFGLVSLTLLDYLCMLLAFSFSLEWFTQYQTHFQLAIVAVVIYYHLRHINVRNRKMFKIVCASLAIVGSSLKLMSNYQATNQYTDELYMHEILPPSFRVSRNHSLEEFDKSIAKLKTDIDSEREKALKEKADKNSAKK